MIFLSGWAGLVARIERGEVGFWLDKLREGDHLIDLDVGVMMTLKLVLKNSVERPWAGFRWSRIVTSGGLL